MKDYVKNPECPQCEWGEIKMLFSIGLLECRCERCGYQWKMKAKSEMNKIPKAVSWHEPVSDVPPLIFKTLWLACFGGTMSDEKTREWWIVETKHSFFIYEDELTASKEADSQAEAHGEAGVICVVQKSAYEREQKNFSDLVQKYTDVTLKYSKAVDDLFEARVNHEFNIGLRDQFEDDLIAERARSAKLVEALKQHHKIWSENGICLSECTLLCNALAEYSGGEGEK